MILITLVHHGKSHTFDMQPDATVSDLATQIQDSLGVPVDKQKLMVSKMPMLKAPFGARPIAEIENKKITLLGPTNAELVNLAEASEKASAREKHLEEARRNASKLTSRYGSSNRPRNTPEDSQYTFQTLRPLPNLPRPERSLAFLQRLKADRGIRAAMRAHKFSVGLLTEMDPLSYIESSHEGTTRILGLNRNKGEVIELRLRTDAYDGYRDYKMIRNTLCHELAHNVHGPHDRKFWDLCHQIEREVAKWGQEHTLGGGDAYQPSEEIAYDHGGWTGGEFVLGGGGSSSLAADTAAGTALSRREIIAKAAEERLKKEKEKQADP
ncbi:WLM-domain-containing protein [Astrocystis sublimbata]|nr:WLM-domain-containing protein [Astrocystis sublimbata]